MELNAASRLRTASAWSATSLASWALDWLRKNLSPQALKSGDTKALDKAIAQDPKLDSEQEEALVHAFHNLAV